MIKEDIEESLCGLLFNAMGYLHEHLKGDYNAVEIDGPEDDELNMKKVAVKGPVEIDKPKFKAGDEVSIKLHMDAYSVIDQVRKCNDRGSYIRKSDVASKYDHLIQIGDDKLEFYDDEISPVGDN